MTGRIGSRKIGETVQGEGDLSLRDRLLTFARVKKVIHWFRRDLRISDNTALSEVVRRAEQIISVALRDELIHQPWGDPLLDAKTHYPPRIVLHEERRGKCLAMFKKVKGA